MTGIEQVLALVRIYGTARQLSAATVSTRFLGGGRVVRNLVEGRDMGTRRIERAIDQFAREWPADAVWPDGVARPFPAGAAE